MKYSAARDDQSRRVCERLSDVFDDDPGRIRVTRDRSGEFDVVVALWPFDEVIAGRIRETLPELRVRVFAPAGGYRSRC